MADIVVAVPTSKLEGWLHEGDLPGSEWSGSESHFWVRQPGPAQAQPHDRCYIVSGGMLIGFAPIVRIERVCALDQTRACVIRHGGARVVTLPFGIIGFRGYRYRWWERDQELDATLPDLLAAM